MKKEALIDKRETSAPASDTREAYGSRYAYWQVSLAIAVFFLALDFGTKIWAERALRPEWWGTHQLTAEMWESRPAITVVPGCFRLVYAENRGAAFSMLDGHVSLLGLFSVVAVIGLFFYWRALPPKPVWGRAAIALIVSGAAGNMFDRLARGYVVDFFDAYIGTHHWPTFNVADSCICVGAGIMIVLFLMRKV